MRPLLPLVLLCAACATTRDFRATTERITDGTAWTEARGTVRTDLAVGGTGLHDLVGAANLTVALPRRTQVEINAAHAALGLMNLHTKWNAVDSPGFALGVQAGMIWLDPQRAWVIRQAQPEASEALAGAHLVMVPLRATATVPVAEPVDLDLSVGWDHVGVLGRIDGDVLLFDGTVGVRRAWVMPAVRTYVAERFALEARATLPLWAGLRTDAEAEFPVQQGVVVGVRSSDWTPIAAARTTSFRVLGEARFDATHVRLGASTTGLLRAIGIPATPYAELYWRW